MTTAGGGWTVLTLPLVRDAFGGSVIEVEAADDFGIDAEGRPHTQATNRGHAYQYRLDFPGGHTQFRLRGYQIRANANASHNSEIDPPDSMCGGCGFAQTDWGVAYRAEYGSNPIRGNIGDVSFGTPDAAGPATSYGATLATQWQCASCISNWPAPASTDHVGASTTRFQVAWGETGGQTEALYPWWAGEILLR